MAKTMKAIAVASILITILCSATHMKTGNELSVTLAITFGTVAVFVITLILAAGFDTMFVMMQRYNRPRIVKLISKDKGC